jgi:hypothetical protein
VRVYYFHKRFKTLVGFLPFQKMPGHGKTKIKNREGGFQVAVVGDEVC